MAKNISLGSWVNSTFRFTPRLFVGKIPSVLRLCFFFQGGGCQVGVYYCKSQFDTGLNCDLWAKSHPTNSPGFPMGFLGLARLQLARSGSQLSDPEGCLKGQPHPGCRKGIRFIPQDWGHFEDQSMNLLYWRVQWSLGWLIWQKKHISDSLYSKGSEHDPWTFTNRL